MADIRIKDLTTTASSTASDDFIAVDGTTNGTRKLNAFSPTFGGNATVTGTLTVSGGSISSGTAVAIGAGGSNQSVTLTPSGAATAGSLAVSRLTSTSQTLALLNYGTDELMSIVGSGYTGIGARSNTGFIFYSNNTERARFMAGGNLLVGTTTDGGQLLQVNGTATVLSTTASTTTSSGALVVSGGVGVAGAINAGGSLVSNPLHTVARKLEAQIAHSVSTEDYLRVSSNSGTTNTYGGEFGYGLTAGGSPEIRFNRVHAGTVTNWLTVPTSTGNATFAGAIAIGNTVNTVSPTSPNRTITMVIGGTTYYLHAKTTND
jgi:hypothetical protein